MHPDLEKRLRGWGVLGNAIAAALSIITTNFVLAMSIVAGIATGVWTFATDLAHNPNVQAGVGVFLAVLWTCIGVAALRDRKRPRVTTPAQDYNYGLTFEGLAPHYDPEVEKGILSFGIVLRNYLPHPIRYVVERLDVRFKKRSLPPVEEGKLTGYIPRGGGRISRNVPFEKDDIKEFFGKEVKGTIDLAIVYGHPEKPPTRRLKMGITLDFTNEDGKMRYSEHIASEKDEPI